MPSPNPGSEEPWLERREDVAGYTPPEEEYGEPDTGQLAGVADSLHTIDELERYLMDYYSKCQRQGVVERLDELGHDRDEEFLILKQHGDTFRADDRFVLGERIDVLDETIPGYRERILETTGDFVDFNEDGGDTFTAPLADVIDVLDHGVENEYSLEQELQELDREDSDIIRHYVENRKGQGQRHSDPADEFITRDSGYALENLLGDVKNIAVHGVDALDALGDRYRAWGERLADEMERRRRLRDSGGDPVEPWKYRLTNEAEDVDYIY